MSLTWILNSEEYICCSKVIIKKLGVFEALVLGELRNVAQRFAYEAFHIKMEDICGETGMSEYQARKALNRLNSAGLVSMKKMGIPGRNYYKVNNDSLSEFLTEDANIQENNKEVF